MALYHQLHQSASTIGADIVFAIFLFLLGISLYIFAVVVSNRKYKHWPVNRTVYWTLGMACIVLSIAGPITGMAHTDFRFHMVIHLLLGMLAPLLIVLASPMRLLLRTIPAASARRITRLLKSRLVSFVTDPLTASILNIGGLYVLYNTNLYTKLHENLAIYLFIHVHLFLAGYVFTLSMIYTEPFPHRKSFKYRSIILILALAAHSILSKYIYAHPPNGVLQSQAEIGGMLMYYGGDIIDAVIIYMLWLQWYKSNSKLSTVQ